MQSLKAAVLLLLLLLCCDALMAQTSGNEFWPAFHTNFELNHRTRLKLIAAKEDGHDFPFNQSKLGAILSYRMKRILQTHRSDIDEEHNYNLVVGGGYEFLQTDQNGSTKREHRILLQAIPKYTPGTGFLVQDRSQMEFRWVDDKYDFRYRNKLIVDRQFKIDKFRFSPYASGELFWDHNHHAWNENQYAFGVQIPYRKLLMVDTYYMRQNCTTCSEDPLNILGVTVNLYVKRKN